MLKRKRDIQSELFEACRIGDRAAAESLLARGANINQAMVGGTTPLSSSCEKGHLSISELLIVSKKFHSYTPDQLKKIIRSCADAVSRVEAIKNSNRLFEAYFGPSYAMAYSIIGYQCRKHMDDPNYTSDAQEQSIIERGQQEKVRQTKLLVSLFVSQTRNYPECSFLGDLCEKMSSYLPQVWLRR